MTLPFYLWGAGAESLGLELPNVDRVRCSQCSRWTRAPAFYPGGRVLCPAHHRPLVDKAKTWATDPQSGDNDPRSRQ